MNIKYKKSESILIWILSVLIVIFLFFFFKPLSVQLSNSLKSIGFGADVLDGLVTGGDSTPAPIDIPVIETNSEVSPTNTDQNFTPEIVTNTALSEGSQISSSDQNSASTTESISNVPDSNTNTEQNLVSSSTEVLTGFVQNSTSTEVILNTISDNTPNESSDPVSTSSPKEIVSTPNPEIIQARKEEVVPLVVKNVSSPILSGTFHTGVIPIIVTFNKPIVVVGTPKLILSTGNPSITAVNLKVKANNKLYFSYQITPGNSANFLDYVSSSALDLNGGSIKDILGSNANVDLPSPGSPNSLSGSSQIIIGTQI